MCVCSRASFSQRLSMHVDDVDDMSMYACYVCMLCMSMYVYACLTTELSRQQMRVCGFCCCVSRTSKGVLWCLSRQFTGHCSSSTSHCTTENAPSAAATCL